MKKILLSLMYILCLSQQAFAEDKKLNVENIWVRSAPPTMKVHALYMDIENKSEEDRKITALESPLYEAAELHKSIHKEGIVSMEKVEVIELPKGQKVTLAPAGLHGMLIKPKKTLELGEKIPVTLTFANGEKLSIEAEVKKEAKSMDHRGSNSGEEARGSNSGEETRGSYNEEKRGSY